MDIQAVAFSGHRPKKLPWKYDETSPDCVALKKALRENIDGFIAQGILHYLSGMAEGVDTWAAETVLEARETHKKIKLHCVLPCVGQADAWSAASRERYRAILNLADGVFYVNRERRRNCMLERDRFLVSHSTILFAVYNGEKRGGTAATVRYARKMGREIFVLLPETLSLTHEKPEKDCVS